MRKSIIISAALGVVLLAATPAAATPAVSPEPEQTGVMTVCEKSGDGENMAQGEEAKTITQSERTRRMIQAEKARNAAENDRYGGAITLIAMSIVLSALIILSVLFLIFGKVSTSLQKHRKRKAHGVSTKNADKHHDELDPGEVIAAISMALAEHEGLGHDMEDTILTIRRMRKAYSPWNSKIYNLRIQPEHVRNKLSGLSNK